MLRSALFLALLAVCLTALQCTASEVQTSDVDDHSLSGPSGDSSIKPPVVPLTTGTGSIISSVGTPQHSEPEAPVDTATTTTTQAVTENTDGLTTQGSTTHVEEDDASSGHSKTTRNTQSSPFLASPENPQHSQDHRTTAVTIVVQEETQGQIKVDDQKENQRQTPLEPQPATTDGRDSQVQAPITPAAREIVDAQDTTLKSTSGKGIQGRETSSSPSAATTNTLTRETQAQTVAAGLPQTHTATKTTTDVTQTAPQLTGQNTQTPTPSTPTISVLAPKSNPTPGQNPSPRETTTQTTATDTSGKVTTPEKAQTTTPNATAVAAHPANPKTTTSSNTASVPGDKPATNTPGGKTTIQAPTLHSTTSTAASPATTQTSFTSTAEPAKKESTPPGNLSKKLPKAIQSLDMSDSSVETLSLFAFAALPTLVLLAVTPAF